MALMPISYVMQIKFNSSSGSVNIRSKIKYIVKFSRSTEWDITILYRIWHVSPKKFSSCYSPRSLPIPGSDLQNVCVLRTPEDGKQIADASKGKHVVIIGTSFIGKCICKNQPLNVIKYLGVKNVYNLKSNNAFIPFSCVLIAMVNSWDSDKVPTTEAVEFKMIIYADVFWYDYDGMNVRHMLGNRRRIWQRNEQRRTDSDSYWPWHEKPTGLSGHLSKAERVGCLHFSLTYWILVVIIKSSADCLIRQLWSDLFPLCLQITDEVSKPIFVSNASDYWYNIYCIYFYYNIVLLNIRYGISSLCSWESKLSYCTRNKRHPIPKRFRTSDWCCF